MIPATESFWFFAFSLFLTVVRTEEPRYDKYRTCKGPLTTIFTPPSGCLNNIRTREAYYNKLELGCEGPGGNECCPEGWASNRYFSPGVCPSGYQACTLPTTRQRKETTNLCCPQNFDCATSVDYPWCWSALNTPSVFTYTTSDTVSVITEFSVHATPIQIRFQASDSSVIPIPTNNPPLPPPFEPLNTGAKVGITLGVLIAVICLCIAAFILGHRRGFSRGNSVPMQTLLDVPPPYPDESSK